MVLHYDQIIPTTPAPGITRRILARGGAMMGVEASFEKGAVGAAHRHPHGGCLVLRVFTVAFYGVADTAYNPTDRCQNINNQNPVSCFMRLQLAGYRVLF